jgi:DNA processing protein
VATAAGASRDELAAYLALAQVPGIGAARLRTLTAAFQSAAAALQAPHGAIAALPGFGRAAATAVRAAGRRDGHAILDQLDRLGATVLLPDAPHFPALLREVPEPPALLYAWGDAGLLGRPAVGIVGSRNHTAYGAAAAQLLAAGVARAGAVVVSGMARGIDAIAHAAALDAGGGSVGVLGNGFGVIYPAANRALYDRMVAHGCLVTELPPGERPHAHTFPRRNRLISGLAGVTVIVEAAPGSGALITADCGLDQGRSVLAVPGPITSATSLGCNKLIQQGAKPALSAGDILEELGLPGAARLTGGEPPSGEAAGQGPGVGLPARALPPDLSALQRSLWDALVAQPMHVDALVAAASAETGAVLTALTELELRGLVRQEPGMRFGVT